MFITRRTELSNSGQELVTYEFVADHDPRGWIDLRLNRVTSRKREGKRKGWKIVYEWLQRPYYFKRTRSYPTPAKFTQIPKYQPSDQMVEEVMDEVHDKTGEKVRYIPPVD